MSMTNSTPDSRPGQRRLALLIGLAVTALPLAAQAQRRSPLADAPAIRKRLELRSTRLEVGAGFGSTVNQDFYHSMMLNAKLGFHFTDWLSIAGVGAFSVANMATGFQDRISETLAMETGTGRAPTAVAAKASMSKINMMLGAQLEFTPFTGKYSLAGKAFAHYDFYAFVGPGFLSLAPSDSTLPACQDTGTTTSCAVSGLKPGANFGVGLHTFFNQFFALNVELRDIVAQINPSGRDVNGDGVADTNDLKWASTYMVSGNLVVYLPSTAVISQ
jgi:outer membrane beta-barrel protein